MKEYVELWLEILKVENEMEHLKQELGKENQSKLQDLFSSIDRSQQNKIGIEDLKVYLVPLLKSNENQQKEINTTERNE
eukprot:CAMPEP_0170548318 /NCGR_PEP_ID=MMETSP0211-20121228/6643_1 /TAXON_ID=311385 /ORGANISM="Pseudokeronopsis sp., Strain OXSARD2" /LENGTH=78 /DNA_ID=CAMNT_0010853807 /DNA_START=1962 /DNA_END=2198 /DNA_ORIENTATION=+